jgi:hypothetical protein
MKTEQTSGRNGAKTKSDRGTWRDRNPAEMSRFGGVLPFASLNHEAGDRGTWRDRNPAEMSSFGGVLPFASLNHEAGSEEQTRKMPSLDSGGALLARAENGSSKRTELASERKKIRSVRTPTCQRTEAGKNTST